MSEEQLENLPLNGRQFANLASWRPAPTLLQLRPDQARPAHRRVNGGIGRNVNYVIDGGDNTDDTIGGALQNSTWRASRSSTSRPAVQCEVRRSSGGVLTVVTKTGTNNFEGSAWGFFRDDSLATRTTSEELAGVDKQPLERKQYGLAIGGPIVRDRAHFFATIEQTDRETVYTVNTGGILPNLDGTSVPIPFEDRLGTAKMTVDISPAQYLQVRYGFQENSDKYGPARWRRPTRGHDQQRVQLGLASHTCSSAPTR